MKGRNSLSRRLLLAAGLVLGVPCTIAHAEGDGRIGRLPDGRAYRVDAEGTRLVDQIAELEVTNDDLRRQLIALEDELKDKQNRLDRLESGAPPRSVTETTLVSQKKSAAPGKMPDCNHLVSSLTLHVARLEGELREAKQQRTTTPRTQITSRCDYNAPENPLWEQVSRLQRELMEGPTKERYGSIVQEKEDLEIRLMRLQEELKAESARSEDLANALKEKESEVASLEEQIARRPAQRGEARSTLASASTEPSETEAVEEAKIEQPRLSDAQIRASKTQLNEKLSKIASRIGERKQLLDSLKGKSKGVSITAQTLAAKDGRSLDTLREQVRTLDGSTDIAGLDRAISQVAGVLEEDITLLRRLNGAR